MASTEHLSLYVYMLWTWLTLLSCTWLTPLASLTSLYWSCSQAGCPFSRPWMTLLQDRQLHLSSPMILRQRCQISLLFLIKCLKVDDFAKSQESPRQNLPNARHQKGRRRTEGGKIILIQKQIWNKLLRIILIQNQLWNRLLRIILIQNQIWRRKGYILALYRAYRSQWGWTLLARSCTSASTSASSQFSSLSPSRSSKSLLLNTWTRTWCKNLGKLWNKKYPLVSTQMYFN